MDFLALAQQCAPSVHPQTMAAIVKTESGFNPYAIGVNKGAAQLPRQPKNKAEAITTAKVMIESGKSIDMGLGQINSDNLARLRITVEDVFDICKNLKAAAEILVGNFTRASAKHASPQTAPRQALSAYNTGDFTRGIQNGYVLRVSANGQKIAQGHTVPAIQWATQPTNAVSAQALTPHPLAASAISSSPVQQRPDLRRKVPITTDPAMVFGNSPQGQDEEAGQALVF